MFVNSPYRTDRRSVREAKKALNTQPQLTPNIVG